MSIQCSYVHGSMSERQAAIPLCKIFGGGVNSVSVACMVQVNADQRLSLENVQSLQNRSCSKASSKGLERGWSLRVGLFLVGIEGRPAVLFFFVE